MRTTLSRKETDALYLLSTGGVAKVPAGYMDVDGWVRVWGKSKRQSYTSLKRLTDQGIMIAQQIRLFRNGRPVTVRHWALLKQPKHV